MPELSNYYKHHLGILLDGEENLKLGLEKMNHSIKPNSIQEFWENEIPNRQWWNETYPAHNDFNYRHNEWGFRSGPIMRECDVAFYGCSQTYGTGIPESTRWGDLVAHQHGLIFNNFGYPGAGTDKILDIFWATSQHVKMRTAVFMINGLYRPHVVLGNGQDIEYHVLYPNRETRDNSLIKDVSYYKDHLFRMPDEYFEHINVQSIIKIHRLCKLMNIRAIFSSYSDYHERFLAIQKQIPITVTPAAHTVLEEGINHKTARDKSHLGMEANQKLSQLFKDMF
jgi:hypothetical protein